VGTFVDVFRQPYDRVLDHRNGKNVISRLKVVQLLCLSDYRFEKSAEMEL
jgi:hypothetical protein